VEELEAALQDRGLRDVAAPRGHIERAFQDLAARDNSRPPGRGGRRVADRFELERSMLRNLKLPGGEAAIEEVGPRKIHAVMQYTGITEPGTAAALILIAKDPRDAPALLEACAKKKGSGVAEPPSLALQLIRGWERCRTRVDLSTMGGKKSGASIEGVDVLALLTANLPKEDAHTYPVQRWHNLEHMLGLDPYGSTDTPRVILILGELSDFYRRWGMEPLGTGFTILKRKCERQFRELPGVPPEALDDERATAAAIRNRLETLWYDAVKATADSILELFRNGAAPEMGFLWTHGSEIHRTFADKYELIDVLRSVNAFAVRSNEGGGANPSGQGAQKTAQRENEGRAKNGRGEKRRRETRNETKVQTHSKRVCTPLGDGAPRPVLKIRGLCSAYLQTGECNRNQCTLGHKWDANVAKALEDYVLDEATTRYLEEHGNPNARDYLNSCGKARGK
jgi:hypothetical protein